MSGEWAFFVDAEPDLTAGLAPTFEDNVAAQGSSTEKVSPQRKHRRWKVKASLPLCSEHNLANLKTVLRRDQINDVFLFVKTSSAHANDADSNAPSTSDIFAASSESAFRFLDPSLTAIELLLSDGCIIAATVDPLQHLRVPRALPTFASAAFRFQTVGAQLDVSGQGGRRVVRVGADGWGGGTAICGVPFDSDAGLTAVSLRISTTRLRSIANKNDSDAAAGGLDADGHRRPPMIGEVLPIVAIGVIDDSFDPTEDSATVFGKHNKAWMLNTVTGALHAGSRQLFVDSSQFTPAPSIILTLSMNTETGSVFVTQSGRHVGGFQVSKYLAQGMYPCVELYTKGATVELL